MLGLFEFFAASPLFAQAETGRQGNFMQTLVMIGIAIIFFYFILWRPERKRRKALENQRSSMKTGDRVTAMGIVGTLDRIEEKTVILKMVDGGKVEILKMAISEVQPAGQPTEVQTEDKK